MGEVWNPIPNSSVVWFRKRANGPFIRLHPLKAGRPDVTQLINDTVIHHSCCSRQYVVFPGIGDSCQWKTYMTLYIGLTIENYFLCCLNTINNKLTIIKYWWSKLFFINIPNYKVVGGEWVRERVWLLTYT